MLTLFPHPLFEGPSFPSPWTRHACSDFPVKQHGLLPATLAAWCLHCSLCLSEVLKRARGDFLSNHVGSQGIPARDRLRWMPAGPWVVMVQRTMWNHIGCKVSTERPREGRRHLPFSFSWWDGVRLGDGTRKEDALNWTDDSIWLLTACSVGECGSSWL